MKLQTSNKRKTNGGDINCPFGNSVPLPDDLYTPYVRSQKKKKKLQTVLQIKIFI